MLLPAGGLPAGGCGGLPAGGCQRVLLLWLQPPGGCRMLPAGANWLSALLCAWVPPGLGIQLGADRLCMWLCRQPALPCAKLARTCTCPCPPPLQYRAVPCNYQPTNPAPKIANPTPGERSTQRQPAACLLCARGLAAPRSLCICCICCISCTLPQTHRQPPAMLPVLWHPSLQASTGPARR